VLAVFRSFLSRAGASGLTQTLRTLAAARAERLLLTGRGQFVNLTLMSIMERSVMPDQNEALCFFKCSVSEDLYGASPNASGEPLPTPGGGKWIPLVSLEDLGPAAKGYDPIAARRDIEAWGCHWFTSQGPRDIYWGPDGPPPTQASGAHAS
jgi:hypothetical protein